ncbi:MAG: GGDEF domain-containing protein [Gammaproteobacteria bacterium]|jgi:diguanylate cyclase (GGDEF)-like protein|nr:GGDEF domain-containing protein [Gammaproteobacteria bacterium]
MPKPMDDNEFKLPEESYRGMVTVLDSLDALVYVCDMQTYELLFVNQYGASIWGDIQGKTCWKVLQAGQDGPCSFCTNDRLLDEFGAPKKVYVWEFQNTVDKRWYQCRDRAIPWIDGRLVRLEIATDITDKKQAEELLTAAKKYAEELAQKDELTALKNRRAFFEQGNRVSKQAKRFSRPISVIMMDIDHFKMTNDNYGHAIGDKVLQAVAEPLQRLVREIDIVARMGGEEFAFILPETGLEDAANLAERLRSEIEKLVVTNDGHQIRITASFGVVTCKDGNKNIEALLTDADDALYIAKKHGRNQVKS